MNREQDDFVKIISAAFGLVLVVLVLMWVFREPVPPLPAPEILPSTDSEVFFDVDPDDRWWETPECPLGYGLVRVEIPKEWQVDYEFVQVDCGRVQEILYRWDPEVGNYAPVD